MRTTRCVGPIEIAKMLLVSRVSYMVHVTAINATDHSKLDPKLHAGLGAACVGGCQSRD